MKTLQSHSGLDERGLYHQGSAIQRQAEWLGYAGLIPFVTLAMLFLLVEGNVRQEIGRALVGYGAVIISFLGAAHWAIAISGTNRSHSSIFMLIAVLPALLGWMATLLPLVYGAFIILISLCMLYLIDSHRGTWCAWYLVLRRRLTFIAAVSIAAVLIAVMRG